MKKLLLGTILLALIMAVPIPTMAMGRVDVGVSIPLPPPIGFAGPPEMVVIPETYIYVVPDSDEDIFFYSGWWWRPWNGRWYRSQNYSSGWGYYQGIPSFYVSVPSGWRNDYRQRRWGGHEWNYQRIPQQQVQQNWQGWERDRHWERQNTWGVRDLRPRTRSQQPSQTVQPKPQARPQYREVQQQQSRPQARDIQEQQYRPQSQNVEPQVRKAAKPQQLRPRTRDIQQQQLQPQSQPVKRQVRKADKQQSRDIVQPWQSRPQSQKSQKVEPQVRKADKPQQSKSRKGKPEREKEEEQNRR